jgi:hypothetical protein
MDNSTHNSHFEKPKDYFIVIHLIIVVLVTYLKCVFKSLTFQIKDQKWTTNSSNSEKAWRVCQLYCDSASSNHHRKGFISLSFF